MAEKIEPGMMVELLVDGKSTGRWITLSKADGCWLLYQNIKNNHVQIGPVHESILTRAGTVEKKLDPIRSIDRNIVAAIDIF